MCNIIGIYFISEDNKQCVCYNNLFIYLKKIKINTKKNVLYYTSECSYCNFIYCIILL